MKSGAPWHVKGVRPHARHSAQDAARRAGLSVGEWLNSVILDSAPDDHGQPDDTDPYAPPSYRAQRPQRPIPTPAYGPAAEQVAAINRRLEGLTQGFENLARTTAMSRAPSPQYDANAKQLADAIARLDQRLEDLAQEGRNASKALERRVESVDRALSSIGRARPNAGHWPSSMDQAMAEISQRQHELDADPFARPHPTPPEPRVQDDYYPDVQQKLRHITEQIDALGAARMQETIGALRNDLIDIARTLTDASPRHAIEALEGEVRMLASRVGGSGAAGNIEQGLAEVRDALRALTPAENLSAVVEAVHVVSHRIDQLASSAPDPTAMAQLEGAIAGLRDILSHVASRDALAALTEEVRALAARVDSIPAARDDIFRTLEQRIATIADAIEQVRASGRAASPDIDAMVRTLGDKIERMHAQPDLQPDLARIDDRISELVSKLDASEARLGNLDAIERGMKELLGYLADMRGNTPAVVKPEVIARDVRRAEQSIEAAHDTIGDVVDRLAMIETGIRSDTAPAPARPGANTAAAAYQTMPSVMSPPLQAAAPHVHPIADAPKPAAARATEPQRPPGAAQARPAADGTLPYDFPLEPGSGKPRPGIATPAPGQTGGRAAAAMASPAERIARSKAVLEPAAKAAPADADHKSNFILAARRAAQFAAEGDSGSPAKSAVSPAAADGASPSLMSRVGGMIKPVLIGVSVLVLVAAGIHMAVNFFMGGEPVVEAPKEPAKPQSALPLPTAAKLAQSDFSPTSMLGRDDPPQVGAGSSGVLTPAPSAPPSTVPVTVAAVPATPSASVATATVAPPAPATPAPPVALMPPAPTPTPKASESPVQVAAVSLAPPDAASSTNTRKLSPPSAGLFPDAQAARAAPPPSTIGGKALIAAAEAGDPAASYEMAVRYFEGRGVPVSTEESAIWFERAARKGLTQALFRLGGLYEKGTGVKKDLPRARALYAEAADRGNAKAMHNLAVLYADGIDGKPDYGIAVRWFHKAASRGVADSQYNLGVLYARGIGMEQNLAESYKWFSLAAANGDKDALQKRDDVGKRLDAQTIAAVQASLAKWTPEPQPDDAVAVYTPPGGWDQGAPVAAKPKAKNKRAQQAAGVNTL